MQKLTEEKIDYIMEPLFEAEFKVRNFLCQDCGGAGCGLCDGEGYVSSISPEDFMEDF